MPSLRSEPTSFTPQSILKTSKSIFNVSTLQRAYMSVDLLPYYSLKTDKFITTLEEEIHYAEKYMQIEKIKYGKKFDYDFEIDNGLESCSIVKFTLQPILENCVEHGFKKLGSRQGMIILKAFKNGENLIISITDNGIEMTDEEIKKAAETVSSENSLLSGKHIGLANVNQRIKLLFGEQYGISPERKEQGLSVTIVQPIRFSQ